MKKTFKLSLMTSNARSPLFLMFLCGVAHAADLYDADFSVAGIGATHDNGADTLEASPIIGGNWSMFWIDAPATDGSTNRFITEDGLLVSEDWGGEASFETDDISVTGETTIKIEALGATRGTATFNSAAEGFTWYYLLDGVRTDAATITNDGSLDYSVEIDVSGASTLVVGFTFNVNGAGDGFEISSVQVNDGVPTPEITLALDPPSISENGGTSTVTVTLSAPPAGDLVLDLAVDDLSEASVPTTATISGGALSTTFQITGQNDADSDGPQVVNLTVSDPGGLYADRSQNFVVTDDEAFNPPNVILNEIRINANNSFTGDGEYFELRSSQPNVSLDRVFLVAIGDGTAAQGSGVVEEIIDLTGQTMNGNFFVASDPEQNFVLTQDLSVALNFEDDNVTFLLVSDFAAVLGDDLDADNDGTLDLEPWGSLLDAVSLVSSEAPTGLDELVYAGTLDPAEPVVGPDSTFIPAHIYRSGENPAIWLIGTFFADGIDVADTPGADNSGGDPPVSDDLEVVSFVVDANAGTGVLTVNGLGAKIWVLQSSGDLNQVDSWVNVVGGFAESDNPDGSTNLTFSDSFGTTLKRFYRLIEQL
ncbi:hypothetical protein OAF33_01670 [bacterium]|nr:hypothetical protein [bacterium]